MKEVLIQFNFPQGTKQQYDNVWRDLKAAGHGHPKGLLYHVCAMQGNNGFIVIDVWESEAAFMEFGNVLRPILERHDVVAAPPQISPVYGVYEPHKELVTF